jgi:hypothetical protein
VVALAILTLILAACGSAGSVATQGAGAPGAAAPTRVPGVDQGRGAPNGPAATAAPGATQGTGNGGNSGGNAGNGNGGTNEGTTNGAFRDLAKIVYTGSLGVEVEDIETSVRKGRDAVLAVGGYIGGSQQSADGERTIASVTYRIPADRWEDALEKLRALGEVRTESIDSAEVTGQIVDLEARIRNLRATEAGIQRIADEATLIEDVLTVQNRLTEIRGQIEQLDAQRTSLEDQADLGTLTVTYTEAVPVATPTPVASLAVVPPKGWSPGEDVQRATSTLIGMLEAIASIGIWIGIVWLPVIAVVLAVVLGTRFALRRTRVLERVDGGFAGPGGSGR